jgi:outer membrane protein TolC
MRKIFAIIAVLVMCCSAALALMWNEALSIGERNSHELAKAKKELESSEWSYRRAISAFLPQLSASAGMTETINSTTSATSRSYSYGVSATQYLFKGTEGIYGIRSAYANVEYNKASLQATRATVLYDLRSAFIDLLYAQENIALSEKILEQQEQNARLIQLRYESGKEDKGNLMTTQADEAQAKYDLSAAGRDLKLARLKLSQLLQLDVSQVEEPGELKAVPEPVFDELLVTAPSYITASKQLEMAELSQKASVSGFLPSLSLSGNLRKKGSDWPPDEDSKSWSLNLSYSFFPGGSNIAERAIAGADLDQAREEFDKGITDLRYSLEEDFEGFRGTLDALEISKISLAAAEERAKITNAKYLNGLTGYDEWYRIENAYIQAQKQLLSSKRSALEAEAAWHKSYGGYVK